MARSAVETQTEPVLPEALDMGEWDRLRSDFVKGENFDFMREHGFAVQTDLLRAFAAEHEIDRVRGFRLYPRRGRQPATL